MKKLVVIPGYACVIPCIQIAHGLGIYVITADNRPSNPAHAISDEYINVNMLDQEALLDALKDKGIDGIMTFGYDAAAVPAAYVAEQLGLPGVGPYESVCILQDKWKFRAFLKKHGFNVPKSYSFNTAEEASAQKDSFPYPVIVKPTDCAGSKGVSKVENAQALKQAVENAFSCSRSKQIVIEEFLEPEGYPSDCDSFVADGQFMITGFSSQLFDQTSENPFVPAAYMWPCEMPKKYQDEISSELQRLISLLKMKSSIYNIETRVCKNGKAYIMECAPRSGGNRLAACMEYMTGAVLQENAVRAAVGMELVRPKSNQIHAFHCELLLHANRTGIFEGIHIEDSVKDHVVYSEVYKEIGSALNGFHSSADGIALLQFAFDSKDRMQDVVFHPEQYVQVLVKETV